MYKNVKLFPKPIPKIHLHPCHSLGSLEADAKIELAVQDIS